MTITEAAASPNVAARIATRATESLAAEEAAGQRLAIKGRTFALVTVAFLLLLLAPFPEVLFYEAFIVVFIVLGFVRVWLEGLGLYREWQSYVQTALDFALLAVTLVVPNPWAEIDFPPQMDLRFGNFIYFYIMLIGHSFSYRPRLLIFCGIAGALFWSIAVAWVVSHPDTILALPGPRTAEAVMALLAAPTFVDLDMIVRDIVVFLIVAGLLALVVARSRRLVQRQATLERDRANLARYFKPATVDRLVSQDGALTPVREQDTAVLFADLVGFTHWAERHSPPEVIGLLREVHSRLEQIVFRHDGTLDKFIGDGMMATFGTPDPGPRDAVNAVACVTDMLAEFETWNEVRRRAGQEPIRISLGLHYGPVVVGNIGTDRRLEFGVLGDTVNVASRLEAMTRQLDCKAVISATVAEAVRNVQASADLLKGFVEVGPQVLRGREEMVPVLTYG